MEQEQARNVCTVCGEQIGIIRSNGWVLHVGEPDPAGVYSDSYTVYNRAMEARAKWNPAVRHVQLGYYGGPMDGQVYHGTDQPTKGVTVEVDGVEYHYAWRCTPQPVLMLDK